MTSALSLRPRRFQDVIGQEVAVRILKNAVASGKVATASIFVGPSGVGKTSLARLVASGLNCTAKGAHPCGQCTSCQDIADGRSEHVIEVDAASDRGVSMVEDLQNTVNLVLPDDTWRVFILDEAHQLSAKAWGALLKTIEEPPPRNVFVFATTEEGKIPKTVANRAATFAFRPLSEEQILKGISDVPFDAAEGVREYIARESGGSLRAALHVVDQLALLGATVSLTDAESVIGNSSESARGFADAILDASMEDFIRILDDSFRRGLTLDQISASLADVARDLYMVKMGIPGRLRTNLPRPGIAKNTKNIEAGRLHKMFDMAAEFSGRFQKSRIGLEALFARYLAND